jgi:Ca-activated chloride channel family protein
MAKGLDNAHRELSGCTAGTAQRVIVLTDGQTFDEADCRTAGQRLADANAPLVAIGVGEDYNEELLRDLAEVGRGRPYHLQQMGELSEVLDFEVSTSVREVVTNLQAEFKTVSGVGLTGVTRVYPSLAEMNLGYLVGQTPPPNSGFLALGNIASGDYTVFVLEVTISGMSRPAGRARLMQLQLSGFVPGLNQKAETPLQDVWVEFTPSEDAITQVDEEVLGYVQQRNADRLVQDALQEAKSDLPKARRTLQSALHMTRLIGNATVTRMIEKSLDELDTTGTISPDTRKTVALAGRTRTVKTTGAQTLDNLPSDETIRRLTGA